MVIRLPRRYFFFLPLHQLMILNFFAAVLKAAIMWPWSLWKSRTIWRVPNLVRVREKPCLDCGLIGHWRRLDYVRMTGEVQVYLLWYVWLIFEHDNGDYFVFERKKTCKKVRNVSKAFLFVTWCNVKLNFHPENCDFHISFFIT